RSLVTRRRDGFFGILKMIRKQVSAKTCPHIVDHVLLTRTRTRTYFSYLVGVAPHTPTEDCSGSTAPPSKTQLAAVLSPDHYPLTPALPAQIDQTVATPPPESLMVLDSAWRTGVPPSRLSGTPGSLHPISCSFWTM